MLSPLTLLLFLFLNSSRSKSDFGEYIGPMPYTCISLVFIESSLTMYYHSGITTDGSNLLGLHRFYYDANSQTWRIQEQQTYNYPDPRAYYGSFLYTSNYYIFGGIGPNGIYNDVWSYDIAYQFWTNIPPSEPILPRYSFAYTSFTYEDIFYFAVLGGKSFETGADLFDFYL